MMMRAPIKSLPINALIAGLAMLPLAGCISFGAKPPPRLLTLSPAVGVPVGQTVSSGTAPTISISIPAVPQSLATARVPVQTSETSIAYIKDALWSEQPSRLFARLMADTIAAKTGRVVLSGAQAFADPGAKLGGELRRFGIDGASGDAIVSFEATLQRGADKVFEKRRFEARAPTGAITADAAGAALNRAANQVASEVADWVGK